KKTYLSLDIDVLDPSFAPGTSTPEPFGLEPFDILECINYFSANLIGFDVVEVCPNYDNGQTALLAAKYIRYIIEQIKSLN
ncbi:MAG: arginase family protein, partial [Thermoplasmatales archaeon]